MTDQMPPPPVPLEQDGEFLKKRARVIAVQRSLVAFVVLTALLGLALTTFTSVQGYFARQELLDCIVPEGKCKQAGEQATAEAVGLIVAKTLEGTKRQHVDIREIVFLALACEEEPGVQTGAEIEACVYRMAPELNPPKAHITVD